jgi:hypothetical protein
MGIKWSDGGGRRRRPAAAASGGGGLILGDRQAQEGMLGYSRYTPSTYETAPMIASLLGVVLSFLTHTSIILGC